MTTKEVIARSGIDASLIRAVIRQLGGKDSLSDIRNHGIAGGFSGFIYTRDTVAFFKRNRQAIVSLVNTIADDLGEQAADMVAGFQCLAGRQMKRSHTFAGMSGQDESFNRQLLNEYLPSVYRCLGGGRLTDEDNDVANALAWFAAEEVARAFEE